MANQKTPIFVELGLDEYVAARVEQSDLKIAPHEFWTAASEQRALLQLVEYQAIFCGSLGLALLMLATAAWYFGLPSSPILLAIATTATLAGFALCRAGFNGGRWQRVLTLRGLRSLEFRLKPEFKALFAQVESHEHQILEIDGTGIGTFNSPTSHQPVTKTYGPQALDDSKFPATLFHTTDAPNRKFVMVIPAPSGDWFNFYVWNEPVAPQIAELFDETPDIYPHDEVKRLKAKVAVCAVANFVI